VPFAKFVQVTFVVLAALGVYCFVASAREGETRRACTPLCAMHPDYAARNRLAPDFELPTVDHTRRVRLSDECRDKPVVLIFGSYT